MNTHRSGKVGVSADLMTEAMSPKIAPVKNNRASGQIADLTIQCRHRRHVSIAIDDLWQPSYFSELLRDVLFNQNLATRRYLSVAVPVHYLLHALTAQCHHIL